MFSLKLFILVLVGMGWIDVVQFCFGATTSYGEARTKSCSISGIIYVVLLMHVKPEVLVVVVFLIYMMWFVVHCLLSFLFFITLVMWGEIVQFQFWLGEQTL